MGKMFKKFKNIFSATYLHVVLGRLLVVRSWKCSLCNVHLFSFISLMVFPSSILIGHRWPFIQLHEETIFYLLAIPGSSL